MAALPFAPGSFDLLWCEGAAYIIGVPQALAAWRRLLAPGGRLAFSEAVWLTGDAAPRARALFAGYPAMTDVAGVRALDRRGRLAARSATSCSRRRPGRATTSRSRRGLARARGAHGADPVLAEAREEIAVWRAHGGDYGYGFFVAGRDRRRGRRLVERGDPERWRTAMAAPPAARPGLMALYAFNLEIARAPWVASEPMLAEIRLRWWLDAIDGDLRRPAAAAARGGRAAGGGDPRRRPAAAAVRGDDRGAAADAEAAPHADRAALELYIDHTAGHLMELAARHLGAEGAALPVVRDFARGAGTAALLRALPELRARGRDPLPPDAAVDALAARRARGARAGPRPPRARVPRAAAPALLAGWQAGRVLRRAAADPAAAVRPGGLEAAEAVARAGLLWRAFSGRW